MWRRRFGSKGEADAREGGEGGRNGEEEEELDTRKQHCFGVLQWPDSWVGEHLHDILLQPDSLAGTRYLASVWQGLGLTLGFTLPALTPTVLSLAGAHELVRMDR